VTNRCVDTRPLAELEEIERIRAYALLRFPLLAYKS